MNVYKRLDQITEVALYYAKQHNCNYNIIMLNPDSDAYTYEFVMDSYIESGKHTNYQLITTTDSILAESDIDVNDPDSFNIETDENKRSFEYLGQFKNIKENYFQYTNHYAGLYDNTPKQPKRGKYVVVRTEPKINNNSLCPCNSGNKYKKCCKNL